MSKLGTGVPTFEDLLEPPPGPLLRLLRKAVEGLRVDQIAERMLEHPPRQIELPQRATLPVERPALLEVFHEAGVSFDRRPEGSFLRVEERFHERLAGI